MAISQASGYLNDPHLAVPPDGVVVDHASALGGIELVRAQFKTRSSAPHTHRDLEVGIVTAGSRHVVCDGRAYHASTGSILAFAPGSMHSGRPVDDSGSGYISFLVPMAAITGAETQARAKGPIRFSQSVLHDEELANLLVAIHDALQREPYDEHHGAALRGVLLEILCRYGEVTCASPANCLVLDGFRAVQRHIHEHYDQRLRLSSLAQIAGVGVFKLIRAFNAFTGLTPYAYIEQVRIHHAAELLRTGMGASLVACHTGFADQAHLTRHFKRVLGVPPATYQRRARARRALRA